MTSSRPLVAFLVSGFLSAPMLGAAVHSGGFQREVWNGPGIQDISELRGKPVLVTYWTPQCRECISQAIPTTFKVAEKYPKDLEVLLVESTGADADRVAAFVLKRKWLSKPVMWTSEVPHEEHANTCHRAVVLGPEGRPYLTGDLIAKRTEIMSKVDEQISNQGWVSFGMPAPVAQAWRQLEKGNVELALETWKKLYTERNQDPKVKDTAGMALTWFEPRTVGTLERAKRLRDQGRYSEAASVLAGLHAAFKKLAKSKDPFAQQVKDLGKALANAKKSDPEEYAADKSLATTRTKLFAKGPSKSHLNALTKLTQEHPDSKASDRAGDLLRVAQIAKEKKIRFE